MTSVAALRGLVTKAELIVTTRAGPAGVGSTSPACDSKSGAARALFRFGPAAANSLPPVSGLGTLTRLPPVTPFPIDNAACTFLRPWAAGNVAGAANPTTTTAGGNSGAVFSTDVTSQAIAALNGKFAGMSCMIASLFEGPLAGPVTNAVDCRTAYDLQLHARSSGRGFGEGWLTARSVARSSPSSVMPICQSDIGAPSALASRCNPAAACCVPTPSTLPHNHAPYNASPRAARSCGSS